MRLAVIISAVLHAGILIFASLDLPFLRNHDTETEMTIIPVEMVRITDVTNVREMVKEPEPPKDKPTPPEPPQRRVEMPPPPPMPSSMPLPNADKPKAKPKPPPQQRAQAPRVSPRQRPKPPSRFDASKVSALLDKRQEETNVTEKLAEKYAQQNQRMSSLELQQQTMSIADAVRKRIYDNGCWNVVAGAMDAGSLKVTILMHLTVDGRLSRPPEVLNSARDNGVSENAFRTAAESALRAVRKCVPYDMLPKERYDLWKEMQINFDPQQMLTG